MNLKLLICISSIMTIASYSPTYTQDTKEITETVLAEGAEKVNLSIDFGAGSINLKTDDIEDLARIDIYYTPRHIRYDVDYTKRGETGFLSLESSVRRKKGLDDSENEWAVLLSDRYPMKIDLDLGACDARLDFGRLPISSLNLDIGAASGIIDFSERNPIELKKFEVDAGASSLEFLNLANANFKYFELSIGAASCEIELGREISSEARIDLEVGVGSIDFYVPRGQVIRVDGDDGWFSSLDFHGLSLIKTHAGVWESEGFDKADNKLYVDVDVAMGSVDFYSSR